MSVNAFCALSRYRGPMSKTEITSLALLVLVPIGSALTAGLGASAFPEVPLGWIGLGLLVFSIAGLAGLASLQPATA